MVKFLLMNGDYKILKIEPQHKPDYKMPTKVYFGRGVINILVDLVKESPYSKFLLVAGKHFYEADRYKQLRDRIESTGKVEFYPEKIKKSSFEEVDTLVKYVQDRRYDGVIGIGGGAILDSAKVAAALAKNGGAAEDYLIDKTKEIESKGTFFIAVPTTAGTGSEVTPWSVVWGKIKYSLSSPEFMFPDIAIVDPALTDDCPKYITATAGIDALCQAIEAYWNVKHNPVSDKYALESVQAILSSLNRVVNNPDKESRDKVAWGSLTGGLAFSNTATTICHAISYPITSHWGVAHGQATSLTLPLFIEYILPIIEEGKRQKLFEAMDVKSEKEAAEKIRSLMLGIGLKTKLSELGIPREGIDVIVKEGFDPARAKNSPKIPSPEELREMLYTISS